MTGVPSSAAVVHITVSPVVLQKDVVLATLLHAVSSHQVTVQLDKKVPLLYTSEGVALKQRNAVVRALIGCGLHGAMDSYNNNNCCWAGGHWCRRYASPASAAMAWASMLYWMTAVKEQILLQQTDIIDKIVSELAKHLKDHAFLVPNTAMPTVADYDVALALAVSTPDLAVSDPNVMRWMKSTLTSLHHQVQSSRQNPVLPVVSLPEAVVSKYCHHKSSMPVVFFDGTEDVASLLQQLHQPRNADTGSSTKRKDASNQNKKEQQASGESKKDKKKKQQQQQQQSKQSRDTTAATSSTANEYDISALDIRVGQIVKIWPHESAEKLYCEDIDLGTAGGGIRQVASGLRPFYPHAEQDLLGQKVLVLANLKKRNLVGFPSHGMVLCASNADHTRVELVVPPADAVLGERVWFGHSNDGDSQKDPEPENKVQKKKLTELLLPDLKTNEQGIVVWQGTPARTSVGVVKAVKGMANAQVA